MHTDDDVYRTPRRPATAELRERGSRFIASVHPVLDGAAADAAIAAVRAEAYDATHHCTAYRVGPDGDRFRTNDDGEPGGTAGLPILRQIDGRALTNVLVVVTRYYGGTKLGTGGLIRAYGDAAAQALDAAGAVEHVRRTRLTVRFAYPDTSPAMHTIAQFDAAIVDTAYAEDTALTVAVRRSEAAAFRDAFIDNLGGRGRVE